MMAVFIIGCSKQHSAHKLSITKDLGVVELVEGTPQHFTLGGQGSCTLTGKHLTDGIEIDFVIELTHQNGAVDTLSRPTITTAPGQHCVVETANGNIGLTPTWKTP